MLDVDFVVNILSNWTWVWIWGDQNSLFILFFFWSNCFASKIGSLLPVTIKFITVKKSAVWGLMFLSLSVVRTERKLKRCFIPFCVITVLIIVSKTREKRSQYLGGHPLDLLLAQSNCHGKIFLGNNFCPSSVHLSKPLYGSKEYSILLAVLFSLWNSR